eukprot:CAMPEP_0178614418 /NCGR_PEP_ID=MMETSP0698-20121128/2153_1 /TAXON_ID=265572 /ORGANISM="Extubocellulus spinifer, Strain CCMP396" /LENGTH=186 /DNA_ID=CAMNT_0020253151 /DNA_START=69 /DNA_END=629 /DNA_ORIENTATION=-
MRTHRRLLATAAVAVGVLLSPSAVCAESGAASLRQRAAAASSAPGGGASAGEFGHRSPEEGGPAAADIVAQRPPASGEMAVDDGAVGGRRLMWWNWLVAGSKLLHSVVSTGSPLVPLLERPMVPGPMPLAIACFVFLLVGGSPVLVGVGFMADRRMPNYCHIFSDDYPEMASTATRAWCMIVLVTE